MIEDWMAGTRVLSPTPQAACSIVVFDDVAEARHLLSEDLRELDLSEIEVRASFAGPSRGSTEALSDLLVVLDQIALGAAGSGVWSALTALVTRVMRRRRRGASQPETTAQTVTIVLRTPRGEVEMQRISVGDLDHDEERASFERIVRSIAGPSAGTR